MRPAGNIALALLLLGLWLRIVPLQDVLAHARPKSLWPLLLIPVLMAASGALRATRWSTLLHQFGAAKTDDVFWINAGGGLLNFILPVRAGEAAKLWWLTRRYRVPGGAGLATLLVDKSFDLAATVPVLFLALLIEGLGRSTHSQMLGFAGAGLGAAALLAGLVLVALTGHRLVRARLVTRLVGERWTGRLVDQALSFRTGAKAAWPMERCLLLSLLTLLALGIDALAFAMVFFALGISLSPGAIVVAYVALLLTYALPAGPGYVGSLEVAGTLILGAGLGLPRVEAAGAVLLWHMVNAAALAAFGLYGLKVLSVPRTNADDLEARDEPAAGAAA